MDLTKLPEIKASIVRYFTSLNNLSPDELNDRFGLRAGEGSTTLVSHKSETVNAVSMYLTAQQKRKKYGVTKVRVSTLTKNDDKFDLLVTIDTDESESILLRFKVGQSLGEWIGAHEHTETARKREKQLPSPLAYALGVLAAAEDVDPEEFIYGLLGRDLLKRLESTRHDPEMIRKLHLAGYYAQKVNGTIDKIRARLAQKSA